MPHESLEGREEDDVLELWTHARRNIRHPPVHRWGHVDDRLRCNDVGMNSAHTHAGAESHHNQECLCKHHLSKFLLHSSSNLRQTHLFDTERGAWMGSCRCKLQIYLKPTSRNKHELLWLRN